MTAQSGAWKRMDGAHIHAPRIPALCNPERLCAFLQGVRSGNAQTMQNVPVQTPERPPRAAAFDPCAQRQTEQIRRTWLLNRRLGRHGGPLSCNVIWQTAPTGAAPSRSRRTGSCLPSLQHLGRRYHSMCGGQRSSDGDDAQLFGLAKAAKHETNEVNPIWNAMTEISAVTSKMPRV